MDGDDEKKLKSGNCEDVDTCMPSTPCYKNGKCEAKRFGKCKTGYLICKIFKAFEKFVNCMAIKDCNPKNPCLKDDGKSCAPKVKDECSKD